MCMCLCTECTRESNNVETEREREELVKEEKIKLNMAEWIVDGNPRIELSDALLMLMIVILTGECPWLRDGRLTRSIRRMKEEQANTSARRDFAIIVVRARETKE